MAIGTPGDLGHNQASSGTSLVLTTTANISAGDTVLIITAGGTASTALTGVVDSGATNVYSLYTPTNANSNSANMAVCQVAASLASGQTATASFGGASARHAVQGIHVTGMRTSSPFQEVGYTESTQQTVTTISITSPSPSQFPDLAIGVLVTNGGTDPGTFTPPAGWTAIGGSVTPYFMKLAYFITSGGGTATFNPTWSNSVAARIGLFMLKGAGGISTSGGQPMSLLGVGN